MRRADCCRLAVASLALSVGPAAAEDVTIVSNIKGPTGVTAVSTQYLTEGRARTSDGRTDAIVDHVGGRLVSIDHEQRQVWEGEVGQMNHTLAEMARRFEDVPLAGLLGRDVTEVKVVAGDDARTIAGYACEHVVVSLGDSMRIEVWHAPELAASPALVDALKLPYIRLGPVAGELARLFDEIKLLKGVPLATTLSARMLLVTVESASVATEVTAGPIPAGAFDVPDAYQRRPAPFGHSQ